MIDEIQAHFEREYPKEGCGIIGIVEGKKEWFPCIYGLVIRSANSKFIICTNTTI